MVPLDGSKLAECVLPHVEDVANGCGTEEVILISVTERVLGYMPVTDYADPLGQRLIPEATGKMEKQAQKYLDRVAKGFEDKGIKVETLVLLGNPAEEIILSAKHQGADIIIMDSHGRSGIIRWAHGSVTDKVFRAISVPVLVVRAPVGT